MISINLFSCQEKMFILMGTWVKSLLKQHYLKKKKIYSKLNVEDIIYADYMYAKRRISRFGFSKQHITFN